MTTFNTGLFRIAAVVLLGGPLLSCSTDYEFAYLYEDLPFDMERVERPDIPAREIDIRDFGGIGDGVALNTDAFADAIGTLHDFGGGRLVVPKGVWLLPGK